MGDDGERAANRAGPMRLLFRFGLGVGELAGEGLAISLRLFAEARAAQAKAIGARDGARAAPGEPGAPPPPTVRHVVIGALAAAPALANAAAARTRPARAAARGAARRGGRALARVPGAQRLRRDYRALRLRLAAELDRLSEAGRREEREARLLARLTLDGLFELVAGRLADSPELQQVIEQQSQGLTSSAMAQLREQSARADRTAENIARWLTGHRPRGGR